jgi:hypothetical protein
MKFGLDIDHTHTLAYFVPNIARKLTTTDMEMLQIFQVKF